MFPMNLTVTVSNVAQLNTIMAALMLGAPSATPAAITVENPPAAKPQAEQVKAEKVEEKKSADAPKPEATAHTQPTATAAADAAPEKKAEDSVTFDTLKTAFLELVNEDRQMAKAILTQFGLPTKLSEATPDQYSAIYAAIKAA